MRYATLSILFLTSFLLTVPETVHAQRRQGRRAGTSARQPVAEYPAAVAGEQVGNDEQQVLARVRGYQSQLEREEKSLSQRMAYAARLRQQGLEKKDQSLLDQAEQYERKALAAYQARVKQFERASLNPGSNGRPVNPTLAPKSSQRVPTSARPQTRRRSSRGRSSRSAKKAWGWLR